MSLEKDLKRQIEKNCYYKSKDGYFKVLYIEGVNAVAIEVLPTYTYITLKKIFGDQIMSDYVESDEETFLEALRWTADHIGITNLL